MADDRERKLWHQGDIVLELIATLPKNAWKTGDELKIAGRRGGKEHVLKAKVYRGDQKDYVVVEVASKMPHPEEHLLCR